MRNVLNEGKMTTVSHPMPSMTLSVRTCKVAPAATIDEMRSGQAVRGPAGQVVPVRALTKAEREEFDRLCGGHSN